MEIGIDSFVANPKDPKTGIAPSGEERIRHLLEEIECADRSGIDIFGIGEHHRHDFADSAPAVILAAAAARTKRIRLTSAVTVLSAHDPVRVFQDFATLDLISQGRTEMIVGRGSFIEAYPLFGLQLQDYESLFIEKLDLLLKIRSEVEVNWSGRHRAALTGQGIYPRPVQDPLPIWLGVGGTPESFVRAGTLGLPLMVAIIGGQPFRFRPLVEMYRNAWRKAGHPEEKMRVGVHALGYVAENDEQAGEDFFPGYARAFTEIGKERGWPPTTRSQFEAGRSPQGALLVGSAKTVAARVLSFSKELGGIDRMTFQMSVASLPHPQLMHSIEILGKEVAPAVKSASAR